MNIEVLLGIAGIVLILLGQTAALFYWGGKIQSMILDLEHVVADHEVRLRVLEKFKG